MFGARCWPRNQTIIGSCLSLVLRRVATAMVGATVDDGWQWTATQQLAMDGLEPSTAPSLTIPMPRQQNPLGGEGGVALRRGTDWQIIACRCQCHRQLATAATLRQPCGNPPRDASACVAWCLAGLGRRTAVVTVRWRSLLSLRTPIGRGGGPERGQASVLRLRLSQRQMRPPGSDIHPASATSNSTLCAIDLGDRR